jgi:molybdopterin biosynthesis enzyme
MEAELFKLNPTVQVTNPNSPVTHGLTKREYFAAMALQGYLANNPSNVFKVVKDAVETADILIAELNK